MVSFVKPEDSEKEHQLILQIEEEVYQDLWIPYRKLAICTWDLWMPATKKYDLEARFPWIDTYKEITSCSNCGDFQARRCKTKYKDWSDKNFVHILNWTVIALSRTLAAIVENYQTADKKIIIPEVLRPYMNWEEII
jgi:seryl-tRNA synthetase